MKWNFRTVVILGLAGLICGAIGAAQEPAPYRLTLRDAIQKALQANLNVLVADTRVEEAEGTRVRLQSYRGWKASERALDAGKMDYQDARDLIIRAVASLYLNAQSAAARVDAAQSRVTDSDALYKLAKDRHDAGTATGVDVLRSQVQLANDKQALLVAQNSYKQSLLSLARNLGMRPSTPLELAEPLQYQPLTQPQAESLVPSAVLTRPDYLSLAMQRQGLVEQQRASRARYYPKVSVNGNYGGIGRRAQA